MAQPVAPLSFPQKNSLRKFIFAHPQPNGDMATRCVVHAESILEALRLAWKVHAWDLYTSTLFQDDYREIGLVERHHTREGYYIVVAGERFKLKVSPAYAKTPERFPIEPVA